MNGRVRSRFWLEATMGAVSAGLFVLTLITREWIEVIFGVDPDNGSGTLEWAITGVLLLTTLGLLITARTEWRRPREQPGSQA